ncbi:MAG: divergent PAP2 family protein [Eubacteriales bacterium]|nr:divergent PAP2 family protein [Eubacteriales bacterium]
MTYLKDLASNPVLIPALIAWATAQIIKVILTLIIHRKFDAFRFVGSGGMPSAHSAVVTCVAVSAGLIQGFNSVAFGLAASLAMVVMYDAAGVRRAAGKQAALLNELVENFFTEHYVNEKKLKELLGHTPVEVLVGSVLGALVAIAYRAWA